MADKIKAIFFDIDNTLLDFHKSAKKAIDIAFEKRGFTQPDGFFEIFKRNNNILWKKIESGQITLDELIKTRFDIIFADAGIKLDGYEFELDFRKNLFNCAEKVDNAEEILEYLSGKYLIYAASNGLQKQQENRLEISGLSSYFDDIFTSERIGFSKPSYEFFKGCFEHADGISPKNVMFIGDSLTADISGGNAFGIHTCWFNYLKEENLSDVIPEKTVFSLLDLKKFL